MSSKLQQKLHVFYPKRKRCCQQIKFEELATIPQVHKIF